MARGLSSLSERDRLLIQSVADQLNGILKHEDITQGGVAYIADIGRTALFKMCNPKKYQGYTVTTLLRLLDALEYDVVFVKRNYGVRVLENSEKRRKFEEWKMFQRTADYSVKKNYGKEKAQKVTTKFQAYNKPRGVKKTDKLTLDEYAKQFHGRQRVDEAKSQDDIFGTD